MADIRGADLAGGILVAPEGLGAAIAAKRQSIDGNKDSKQANASTVGPPIPVESSALDSGLGNPLPELMETSTLSTPLAPLAPLEPMAPVAPAGDSTTFAAPPSEISEHTQEINPNLQTTIQSAITDLEQTLDKSDFEERQVDQPEAGNEPLEQQEAILPPTESSNGEVGLPITNEGLSLSGAGSRNSSTSNMAAASAAALPPMTNGHAPSHAHESRPRLRLPHEFKGRRPVSMPPNSNIVVEDLPDVGSGGFRSVSRNRLDQRLTREEYDMSAQQQLQQQQQTHSMIQQESSSFMRSSASSNVQLRKAMTIVNGGGGEPGDTSSLKRRNPREMFTDSAFYSPKHHPSVAEQVEMAHKLSSSLYDEGNRTSVGQEMFMRRAKKSGKWIHQSSATAMMSSSCEAISSFEQEELPRHDKVPNLKLVMNPEGKLHDWTDLPPEELPEMQILAQGGISPDTAHHVVENLEACKGRGGELFAKRKKKSDSWVVDDENLGRSDPRQHAEKFVQQQSRHQEAILQEKQAEMSRKMQEQQRLKTEVLQKQQEEAMRQQQERMRSMQENSEWQQRVQKTRQIIQSQEQPKPKPPIERDDVSDGRAPAFASTLQNVAPPMPNRGAMMNSRRQQTEQQSYQQQSSSSFQQQTQQQQSFSYQPAQPQQGWQAAQGSKRHVEPHFLQQQEMPEKPSWVKEDKPAAFHQPPWHNQGMIPQDQDGSQVVPQQQQQFSQQQQQQHQQQQQIVQQQQFSSSQQMQSHSSHSSSQFQSNANQLPPSKIDL